MDWSAFAYAAGHVGSRTLLQPSNLRDVFVYIPGAAWALAPLRTFSFAQGFAINAGLMLAACVAAALVAERIYALSARICLALILAWAPATYAIVIGQNAPLGLLFVLLSLLGYTRRQPVLTAVPLVLLLYKPTFAIPLIGVLLLRRRWRELAIVALGAIGWYLSSVAATAGDWAWPITLARLESALFPLDFAHNAAKAIGLTTLLLRIGIRGSIVAILAAFVVAASVPLAKRVNNSELYAGACLLGLLISPHAWSYDVFAPAPAVANTGTVVRLENDGSWSKIVGGLSFPTAMTFGDRNTLYISNKGFGQPTNTSGEIVKVHISDFGD